MKRYISTLLVVVLLLSCMSAVVPTAYAATKAEKSSAIAIVFDNSGSMYMSGNQAWCRATYAMEVFAAMLNAGDVLQIYPMWPITIGSQTFSMESPFQITDASQASEIRKIFTEDAGGTPIESIDYAANGLQSVAADKKYLIVLTDGTTFSRNGTSLWNTERDLTTLFESLASPDMTVMYLGISDPNSEKPPCDPKVKSEYYFKEIVNNSEDVLSALTRMCNQIFGRDSLPKSHISGSSIDFDISMSKLIVFVQGEDIANLNLVGNSIDQPISSQQTKYSTLGAGDYPSIPDETLQGMMVTYTDCAAGIYTIEYTGAPTNVEIYYEPDADLDFVFTDANGSTVNPASLYEGDYKVSFGMKDAKTGELISSDLLGNPRYQGSYSINGTEFPITHEGFSGSVDVPLKMSDTFEATLTATYLSGYSITKDSSDFGWPEGGIQVAARPAGELKLEISGGEDLYSLQNLRDGAPYIAKVYYEGTQLTGAALESVELKWDPDLSNADIKKEFADDHWNLYLDYKDPAFPQDTVCGKCTVSIYALYSAQGSSEAQAETPLSYNINDDFSPLQMELFVPATYIVIDELENSEEIVVNLKLNGAPLTAEDFAAVDLNVVCDDIEHTVTVDEQKSAYMIKLLPTEGIAEGKFPITVNATYTDHIGRETQIDDAVKITLSNTPLWVRWTFAGICLLILVIAIWSLLHIKVLPHYAHISKRETKVLVDGEDVTKFCNLNGTTSDVVVKYGGNKLGIVFPSKAGKESFLYKQQAKRYAEVVKPDTIKKVGTATIESATIGSVRYILNDKGVLERKPAAKSPLNLKHGMPVIYSGTFNSAGVKKSFNVNTKLNFKKK